MTRVGLCSVRQHRIYMHLVIRENDFVVFLFQHANIQQGGDIAMNGFNVASNQARGFSNRYRFFTGQYLRDLRALCGQCFA